MNATTEDIKQPKPITGSSLETVRIHNRVRRNLRIAARKLGLTKNGLMAKAIADLVDATIAPKQPSGSMIEQVAAGANAAAMMVEGAN